jgi:hypothetical protein
LAALAEIPGNVEDVDRAAARLRLSRAMVYRLLAKSIRDPTPSALLPSRRGRTAIMILSAENRGPLTFDGGKPDLFERLEFILEAADRAELHRRRRQRWPYLIRSSSHSTN